MPGGRRTDHANLVAFDNIGSSVGIDPDPLLEVAGDDVVFLGIGAADCRVLPVDVDPLLRVSDAASWTESRPTSGMPVEGLTG